MKLEKIENVKAAAEITESIRNVPVTVYTEKDENGVVILPNSLYNPEDDIYDVKYGDLKRYAK